ncbi:YqgE/AlgH family protein [Arsenophonus endosymbiont of Bemisia tabaci]|uniref:YqgE/AlgH family protein n=1 Tax=Arsenophonus endosymbiont of Bemisia tabaci TaxID=536059 RepID=UPI0015F50E90|nr:YqgE/AlgH family protein [Arsenophonus endosymbiont of Bemisia tabaci]
MNLQNHFLIAMPTSLDPYFQKSVVYICEHHEKGAMGFVINRQIEQISINSILKNLNIKTTEYDHITKLSQPVFSGCPIAEAHGFILHSPQNSFSSTLKLSDEIMITTSKDILETLGTTKQPEKTLIALGYSSWEQGQLEKEIMKNSWLTAKANTISFFTPPISERWLEAAALIGIDIFNISNQAGHA